MSDYEEATHPGDPRHAEHEVYLTELGRATYACLMLAHTCYSVLTVHGGLSWSKMQKDPLGGLRDRVRTLSRKQDLPGLTALLPRLDEAVDARNDLSHAMLALHGLHRVRPTEPPETRTFYEVDDLVEVTRLVDDVSTELNYVLYSVPGAMEAWAAARGTS